MTARSEDRADARRVAEWRERAAEAAALAASLRIRASEMRLGPARDETVEIAKDIAKRARAWREMAEEVPA